MALENSHRASNRDARGANSTRRHALALMLGTSRWLAGVASTVDGGGPIRFAIAEAMTGDVNLNDAQAAMLGKERY